MGMGKRLQSIRGKLGITSWQALVHLVVVEIILTLLWDWISKMFTIAVVREIGFLFVFISGVFAVAWYLPKLSPVLLGLKATRTSKPNITRPRLEHDGVLWEDGGPDGWGSLNVIGPLCPKDYTPLATKRGDKIEVHVSYDTFISDSGYHSLLVCPECKAEYNLGENPKNIGDSRLEVGSRFEGKRRREQQL